MGIAVYKKNAWNEITINIPQNGAFPMSEVGLQVVASTEDIDITLYLDYLVSGLPNPPTGLTAEALNLSEISLDWDDNSEENFKHYLIYRDEVSGFSLSDSTLIDSSQVSQYIDTGLEAYAQYFYKITAQDTDGDESPPSDQISIKTSQPGAPPTVDIKEVNATEIGLYKKFEMILDLKDTDYTNPYNPEEVDVQATFSSPTGKSWKIFGFFDDYDDIAQWKIRFSPNELGEWSYNVQVSDKDGSGTSQSFQFIAQPSQHSGWIKLSQKNPHYLEYDNGLPFYGVGMYVGWNLTIDRLNLLEDYLANMFAMWNIMYGGYISSYGILENELGKYNQQKCGRIDQMLEMAEERNLKVMFCPWPHDLFSNTVWAHQWHNNPYREICDVKEVYSDSTCWEYQKKQYRYLIARWSYSRSLAIWEIINEINGTDGWQLGSKTAALNWVEKVDDYFKENDPYQHLTTASKSGGYTEYEPSLYKKTDLPNIHIYENSSWPIKSSGDLLWSSFHNFAFGAKRFWDNYQKPAIFGEANVFEELKVAPYAATAYHNAIWAALTNGLAMTPFWWKLNEVDESLLDRMLHFSQFVSKINFVNESKAHFEVSTSSYDLFGMNGDSTAFGWIRDRYGKKITGKTMAFSHVWSDELDSYKIDYYNPWNGEWFDSRIAPVLEGQLMDNIAEINQEIPDVAFYVQSALGGITPIKLQLTTFTEKLLNTEENLAKIYCFLVDENGFLCNNSDNTIFFEVQGPGQLNANEVMAENGKAIVKYQPGNDIGNVKIIASSAGLVSDTVEIQTTNLIAIDDFEKYSSDAALRSSWFIRSGTTVNLSLNYSQVGDGSQSMKVGYKIGQGSKDFVLFEKPLNKDFLATKYFSFWYQPDGSNRQVSIQLSDSSENYLEHVFLLSGSVPNLKIVSLNELSGNNSSADSVDLSVLKTMSVRIEKGNGELGEGTIYFDSFGFLTSAVTLVDNTISVPLPTSFTLSQNYPNPFNPLTTIQYDVPMISHINISIFNVTGQRIKTLVNKGHSAGRFAISWNASHVASGYYFVRMKTEHYSQVIKCLLLK